MVGVEMFLGVGDKTVELIKMLGWKGCLLIFLLVLLGIVCIQNMDPVSIHFLFWDIAEVPKLLILLVAFLAGLVWGIVVGTRGLVKQKGR
jgi:uncharacterized integral membrane protein